MLVVYKVTCTALQYFSKSNLEFTNQPEFMAGVEYVGNCVDVCGRFRVDERPESEPDKGLASSVGSSDMIVMLVQDTRIGRHGLSDGLRDRVRINYSGELCRDNALNSLQPLRHYY